MGVLSRCTKLIVRRLTALTLLAALFCQIPEREKIRLASGMSRMKSFYLAPFKVLIAYLQDIDSVKSATGV